MNHEKIYQVALSFVPGIGDVNTKQLISYCGSAEAIFKSNKKKLNSIPGIGAKTIEAINSNNTLSKAEDLIEKCQKEGVSLLFYTDKDYPGRLKQIMDSPPLLYVKGKTNFNSKKHVAIVGTRQATEYGKEFTEKLVEGLKPHNALIVSGLAYGIDIQAHKSALKHDLPTVGIMGSGLNIIYPAAHKNTVNQMLDGSSSIMSEYPLETKPDAHNFPSRNRIIAGIADALVVVEAAYRGGALITAEIANSYSKDVFALPGNIHSHYSVGCNNLIKSHKANLITSVKDLEYIMNWEPAGNIIEDKPALEKDAFAPEEWQLLQVLLEEKSEMLIDDLSWRSQLPINQVAAILLNLEFQGLIKSLPGKKYRLIR